MGDENRIAKKIVDLAITIHSELGPGLLESVYEEILACELIDAGITVLRQHPIPVIYRGRKLDHGFRADLIVGGKVIVEIKSLEQLAPVHYKQLLTYLRVADKRLGLMLNFGEVLMKNGIKRIANGMP